MSQLIPVVENPRRKRRRYTAKQRAAGFGGGRRRSHKRSAKRRRNPVLATLSNPRRHSRRRRYYGRRRNGGFGGLLKSFDLPAAGWTGAGMIGTRAIPGIASKWLPMIPTVGPMSYVSKAATVALLGWATEKFVGQRQAQHVTNGGLAMILLDIFDTYLAPKIGMGVSGFVSSDEVMRVASGGMAGFVQAPPVIDGLGAGVDDVLAA